MVLHFFFLAAVFVIVVIIAARHSRGRSREPVLYSKKKLLTANETEFFHRLCVALPGYYVFPQISMGALLRPSSEVSKENYLRVRNRFAAKVVDFVVADDDLIPVVLVELDDRTHSADKDARRDAMTGDAGYVTLRYQSRSKPSVETIRKDVERARKQG